MGFATGLAVYFLIWWIVLFISLPFRMKSQIETGEITDGTEPGAPANPRIVTRLIVNTILSLIAFALFYLIFYVLDFSVDDIPAVIS